MVDPFPNQDMFTETLDRLEDQLMPIAKPKIIISEAVLSGARMNEEEIEKLKSKYEVLLLLQTDYYSHKFICMCHLGSENILVCLVDCRLRRYQKKSLKINERRFGDSRA